MTDSASALAAGRDAAARYAWREAYEALATAAKETTLHPDDLDAFADAAWWMGQMHACIDARERAFAAYLAEGNELRAMRMAAHLTDHHRDTGEMMIANGWLQRARALAKAYPDTAEAGYVHVEIANMASVTGEIEESLASADEAVRLGTAHADRDLMAFGLAIGGVIRVMTGRIPEGFATLDEATIAAVAGELGPMATGAVYCMMIHACSTVADYQRAGQFSEAARRWCERQSIAGFPGICRVHHAEVMKLRGAFADAEGLVLAAADELKTFNVGFTAQAFHELGEIRLRSGDDEGAASAFAQAYELGADPVPGLALLQVRQGNAAAGFRTIKRSLDSTAPGMPTRTKLLPAAVEIALAAGERDAAQGYVEELRGSSTGASLAIRAGAEHSVGAMALDAGDAETAQQALARALPLWRQADMPYEAARTRGLLGAAYLALGDREAARLEWQAARSAFERLGAMPDADDLTRRLDVFVTRAPARRDQKTFMFTDIVSSTNLLEAMGDAAWTSLIDWHDRTLRACLADHGGEEIKHTGDGFFFAFDTPVDAVRCAIQIQQTLAEHRRTHGFAPQIRIGVHAAEASRTGDDDYRGMGVHESARIGGIAGADEIVVSAVTLEGCGLPVPVSAAREVALKGVAETVGVVSVLWQDA